MPPTRLSHPAARSTGAPGTHHVPLLHAVAALEDGGPGGRLAGRGGDVALRAPQQRVGGQVAALPSVPPILQPESGELQGSTESREGNSLLESRLGGTATPSDPPCSARAQG